MTCEEARFALFALLDDELDVAKSLEVLAHLEGCLGCQAEAEQDDRLTALLREHLSPWPAAPVGLWERVSARLDAQEDRRERGGRLAWTGRVLAGIGAGRRPWRIAQAAAMVLLVVVAFVMVVPSRPAHSFLAEEILADHLGSLRRAGGPADLPTPDPAAVIERLRPSVHVPDDIPGPRDADITLVGGSYCQLMSTKGIRFTYAVGRDRTVSVYYLERPPEAAIPVRGTRPLFVGYVEGSPRPGAILWRDERFLYALVGDLPPPALERLAQALLPHGSASAP